MSIPCYGIIYKLSVQHNLDSSHRGAQFYSTKQKTKNNNAQKKKQSNTQCNNRKMLFLPVKMTKLQHQYLQLLDSLIWIGNQLRLHWMAVPACTYITNVNSGSTLSIILSFWSNYNMNDSVYMWKTSIKNNKTSNLSLKECYISLRWWMLWRMYTDVCDLHMLPNVKQGFQ